MYFGCPAQIKVCITAFTKGKTHIEQTKFCFEQQAQYLC